MRRNTAIIGTVAGTALLACACVSAYAVMQAAESGPANASSVQLIAAGAAQEANTPLPELPPLPQAAGTVADTSAAGTAQEDNSGAQGEDTQATQPTQSAQANTAKPKPGRDNTREDTRPSATPQPSKSAQTTNTAARISSDKATQVVLLAMPGTVTSVSEDRHGGYDAWRVELTNTDGAKVAAWVDVNSAVVYDWKVLAAAPDIVLAPQPNPTQSTSGNGSGSYEDDDREDESEHESEDESEHGDENESEHEGEDGDDD